MGSTSYLNKTKTKSGSSIGSDKEMNGKLRRAKIRRPGKMNDYGLKRIPDYTELAYKEAVSKLRYFLSGNYAPSVRSYGGSASIKNLDESDGDLDKKLSSSYHALSEYKPRTRLTAKYTTLYADSLNNQPPLYNVPAPTTPSVAELSGGTNPDVINFIQKQEEYIEQLERESQYCRDELNNLLGKVKEVISENEHLHEAQKNKLITRMFNSYQAGSETDELDDVGDSTGLDSDTKVTPSKARKSAKFRSSKLEGPNIVFESRIAELEAQLTQSKIDLKKIQEENNENKRKLASGLVDSTCLDGFKRQIDNLQRDKSALEAQVSKLKISLDQKDDGLYKRSDLEQSLRDERNNLESELRRMKEELAAERSKVRELTGEGARRAVRERSAAEQRHSALVDDLQHDLAAQYDNVAKLQLDLERQRREENDLKRELSMKNAAIEELKMELKSKTASLQADLAQAHAEKASLEEELASARLTIERNQRQAKHETNRLNSEIQSLRQRLDRADADLVHSRRENLRLSEQIATLEKEINIKNLTPISPEKSKKEKELSTMFESMENKHAKTVAGLESMVHSQNSLMEKLTGECRLLTEKLDDANRRHKEELATLQRQVEHLGWSLQSPNPTPSTYEAPTAHTTATIRNIPHSPPNTRSHNHRADSTRHTQEQLSTLGPDRDHNNSKKDITEIQNEEPHDDNDHRINQDELNTGIGDISVNLNEKADNDNLINQREKEDDYQKQNQNGHSVEEIDDHETTQKYEDITEVVPPIEPEHQQYVDQNYEQNYEQYPDYDQTEYQNQSYDQNYEQQYTQEPLEYTQEPFEQTQEPFEQTQEQYLNQNENYETTQEQNQNYEEYPQYTDPNAQYENYPPDNYQSEQNYENSQYTTEEQKFSEPKQENVKPAVKPVETKTNILSKEQNKSKR